MDLTDETSNQLFEVLSDWNTQLKHLRSQDFSGASVSLSGEFIPTSSAEKAAPKGQHQSERRPAPFSLRLSADERERLVHAAKGAPLGGYIKAKLFADDSQPIRLRRTGLPVEDRAALAQALALLGRSRLSSNLNQLAHAVNIGVLPVTPETEADLREALSDVREIRRLLMAALGMKPEARP